MAGRERRPWWERPALRQSRSVKPLRRRIMSDMLDWGEERASEFGGDLKPFSGSV